MNILITGGASGLGLSVTRKLVEDKNSFVYLTFCSSKVNAEKLENEFGNIKIIKCDFSNQKDIDQLLEIIPSMDLDVLINNALTGIIKKHSHKISADEYLNSFKNNILPTISITSKTILSFRMKRSGKIVTILSSYLLNKPPVGLSEYVAGKNYLLSMSKSWAVENSKFNITSNCISPSFMQTGLNNDVDERQIDAIISDHPFNELIDPKDVADVISFMVSCTNHMNSTNLVLNSGVDVI